MKKKKMQFAKNKNMIMWGREFKIFREIISETSLIRVNKSNDMCCKKWRREHIDTGGYIKTEVEIGMILPYTKEFLESLRARRGKDGFSHRAFKREHSPADNFLEFWPIKEYISFVLSL